METIQMDIVRATPAAVQLTRSEGAAMPTMVVRFAPFNTWYRISSWWEGDFMESVDRGAFTKTMQESGSRLKVMFNHGHDFHIGEKLLGVPSDLREDADSPVAVVPLFDTSYNRDLLPGIEAGAYGSSFMFRIMKQQRTEEPGKSERNPDGLPEVVIKEVKLLEAGPVTWPANPEASVGLRSMCSLTDQYYEGLRARDARRVDDLETLVRNSRTPAPAQPPQGTAPEVEAALHDPIEPLVSQHSGGGMSPRERRERLYPHLRSKGNGSDDRGDAVASRRDRLRAEGAAPLGR